MEGGEDTKRAVGYDGDTLAFASVLRADWADYAYEHDHDYEPLNA